jgi:hypothetical protein
MTAVGDGGIVRPGASPQEIGHAVLEFEQALFIIGETDVAVVYEDALAHNIFIEFSIRNPTAKQLTEVYSLVPAEYIQFRPREEGPRSSTYHFRPPRCRELGSR